MAKDKTAYVCDSCGHDQVKWTGKCPSCGQWNTMKEVRITADTAQKAAAAIGRQAGMAIGGREANANRPVTLGEIATSDDPRIDMCDEELNRVLGGGLVPGSIVLLGGEPGIG